MDERAVKRKSWEGEDRHWVFFPGMGFCVDPLEVPDGEVGVDQGGGWGCMAQEPLDMNQGSASLEQSGGETMTPGVRVH